MKKKINSWNTKRFTFNLTENQYDLLIQTIEGLIEGYKKNIELLLSPHWCLHWEMCYRHEEIFRRKEEVVELKDLYNELFFPAKIEN